MTPENEQRQKLLEELHTAFLTRWYESPFHRDQVTRIFLDWIKERASEKALIGLIRRMRALAKESENEQELESTAGLFAPGLPTATP